MHKLFIETTINADISVCAFGANFNEVTKVYFPCNSEAAWRDNLNTAWKIWVLNKLTWSGSGIVALEILVESSFTSGSLIVRLHYVWKTEVFTAHYLLFQLGW